jgi:hypothetical protein
LQFESPIDICFAYLETQLLNSKADWAKSLLLNYAQKIEDLIDNKYKTYNWNINVKLQEEALKFEAIRECL